MSNPKPCEKTYCGEAHDELGMHIRPMSAHTQAKATETFQPTHVAERPDGTFVLVDANAAAPLGRYVCREAQDGTVLIPCGELHGYCSIVVGNR